MSAPGFVSTKSAASTATSTVNSSPRLPTASAAPTLPALHLAAQTGDLTALYALLSPEPPNTVTATVHDRDPQNITALHWAAINNQVLSCKFLLEQGAEVDARGGELNATPLHWAARSATIPSRTPSIISRTFVVSSRIFTVNPHNKGNRLLISISFNLQQKRPSLHRPSPTQVLRRSHPPRLPILQYPPSRRSFFFRSPPRVHPLHVPADRRRLYRY